MGAFNWTIVLAIVKAVIGVLSQNQQAPRGAGPGDQLSPEQQRKAAQLMECVDDLEGSIRGG